MDHHLFGLLACKGLFYRHANCNDASYKNELKNRRTNKTGQADKNKQLSEFLVLSWRLKTIRPAAEKRQIYKQKNQRKYLKEKKKQTAVSAAVSLYIQRLRRHSVFI